MTVWDCMKYFSPWQNCGIATTKILPFSLHPTNFSCHVSTESFLQMLDFSVPRFKIAEFRSRKTGMDIFTLRWQIEISGLLGIQITNIFKIKLSGLAWACASKQHLHYNDYCKHTGFITYLQSGQKATKGPLKRIMYPPGRKQAWTVKLSHWFHGNCCKCCNSGWSCFNLLSRLTRRVGGWANTPFPLL